MSACLGILVWQDRGVVENCGEKVDGADGDQEEEGGLHQAALADGLTQEDGAAHGEENGRPGAVHQSLVEYQTLTPPEKPQITYPDLV